MPDTNIKVAIRLRPLLQEESAIENEGVRINKTGTSIAVRNTSFEFDSVFSPDVSNKEIYDALVSDKIKTLFDGFNVTILAYGSTGSGKTYTMGTSSKLHSQDIENGLIPLGLKDIFEYIITQANETHVEVKASFFEIFMENVKDLLKSDLSFVPGDSKEIISSVTVKNLEEAMHVLEKGTQYRKTASTAKNVRSSRSHAFFILSLIMTDKESGKSKFAKFQLVDLAGSERAGTDTSGKEFKQGIRINLGLTALGRVISALSKKEKHIPYRDSVLTRYLQDSLGGNSHTIMITCISPANANIEETLSSLRYSYFAKKIKNTVVVNRNMEDLIEHLKSELERLKKSGDFEEKEKLTSRIDDLTVRLDKACTMINKIQRRFLEFSSSFKCIEEQMLLDIYHNPILYCYIDMIVKIKENLDNFTSELSLFGSSVEDVFSSQELHCMSSFDNFEESLDQTESLAVMFEDLIQVHLIEEEIKNYSNLKSLYQFVNCEAEHSEMVQKLRPLLNEKEKLCKELALASESDNHLQLAQSHQMDEKSVKEKISCLDQQIQQYEQQTALCALAVQNKNRIIQHFEDLEQNLEELKIKLKVNLQPKITRNVEDGFHHGDTLKDGTQQSASDSSKFTKLAEEMKMLEEEMEKINYADQEYPKNLVNMVESECINFIDSCLKRDIRIQIFEIKMNQIEQKMKTLEEKKAEILKEIENKNEQDPTTEDTAASSIFLDYKKIIASYRHTLDQYKEKYKGQLHLLNENTAKFLLDHLLRQSVVVESDHHVLASRLKNPEFFQTQRDLFEKNYTEYMAEELKKNIRDKFNFDFINKKKINNLNAEWEIKFLLLLENFRKYNCFKTDLPSHLPVDMTTFLETLWKDRDIKLEQKCQEVEQLKEKLKGLEEENLQLRNAKLKLPILTAPGKSVKAKSAHARRISMTEAFLSEEETSIIEESERLDPDFRATPMWRRNRPKPKRKLEEDETESKPSKALSTFGCCCPSQCSTMRCSCKKKKKECSSFCDCNKAKCVNRSSKN